MDMMITTYHPEDIPFDQAEHQTLVEYLQTATPGRLWVNSYFDLAGELLEATALSSSDTRLVTTLPKTSEWKYFLPIIINTRYVLAGYYYDSGFVPAAQEASENAHPSVGLISERVSWELLDTAKKAKIHHTSAEIRTLMEFFQHATGEDIPPLFLHLKDITYSSLFKTQWIHASAIEAARSSGSMNRERHRPIVYKAIFDLEYRVTLLDEAFNAVE